MPDAYDTRFLNSLEFRFKVRFDPTTKPTTPWIRPVLLEAHELECTHLPTGEKVVVPVRTGVYTEEHRLEALRQLVAKLLRKSDYQLERERIEWIFGLPLGTLHEPSIDHPAEWDGFGFCYEGIPEWISEWEFECDHPGLCADDCMTVVTDIAYGLPSCPPGWVQLIYYTASGECACPACGEGTEQYDATGDCDATCKLCDGDGHLSFGTTPAEVIFYKQADWELACEECV